MSRKRERRRRERDKWRWNERRWDEWRWSGSNFRSRRRRFTGKLYKDPENGVIFGICTGIAHYLGVEPWIVRAVTVVVICCGLTIVIPIYIVLYFILDKDPSLDTQVHHSTEENDIDMDEYDQQEFDDAGEDDEYLRRASMEKESSRVVLRVVRSTLHEQEDRVRQLERFVTSDEYKLRSELHSLK